MLRRTALFLLTALACGAPWHAPAAAAPQGDTHQDGLHFAIGCVLGTMPTKVRFCVHNRTDKAFRTTPLATNQNRIEIRDAAGKVTEFYSTKDGIAPVVIAPGASRSWDIDVLPVLAALNLKQPGAYRVTWVVGGHRSNTLCVFRD